MPTALQILILTDRAEAGSQMAMLLLQAGIAAEWQRAHDEPGYVAALERPLDLILAAAALPGLDAMRALALLQRRDIPLIVIEGPDSVAYAVECMKQGAADYVPLDQLSRLGSAVRQALAARHMRPEPVALDQTALDTALQRQTAFVHLLQTIAEAANAATSLELALQIAIEHICRRIGWPLGHVYLVSEADQYTLRPTAIWYCADQDRFTTFQMITEALPAAGMDDLPGRVLISGKPEWAADMTAAPVMPRAKLIHDIGVRAGFAFPVLVGAEVVAVLEFFAPTAIEPDQALLEVMSHVGTQLGRIVERTRSGAALRASEERYRLIAENTGDIVMLLDANGRQIYNSPSCQHLLGYGSAELLGQTLFEIVHPDDQAGARRWWAASASGSHSQITLRYRHANGRWRWFEVYSTLLIQHGAEYVLGVSRDVTERKAAEEALRGAEAKYRTLVEQIPAIIYTAEINDHSSTSYVSPQIETILGYSPEEWLADPNLWLEQLHPDDRVRVLAAVDRTRAIDAAVPVEYRSFTRDGRVVWLQDAAQIVRDETGAALFMQGITLDITERKHAEAALVEERALLARRVEERTADLSAANAALARAARLKDEFLASMSHELRTPLNAILGLSEALQEQVYGPLSERQAHSLQRIEESGRHLLELINDILDLAKIGAGKLELELEPTELAPICHASLRMVKQLALKKQISVDITADPAVEILHVDGRRLKQILVNLLSNAVKFTPEGGTIGLEVTGDPARQLAYLTVWDTGIGIAEQHISQLFQPFVQLDSRLSRQYEGTGLGLALVYRMVQLQGGGIEVASKLGQGSRFTVRLPWPNPLVDAATQRHALERDASDVSVPTRPHSQSGQAAPQPVLLLAEDNEANIVTFSDYLGAHGYQVVVARNGAEAIARARELAPAIVLMDIQMPGIDGIEATIQIRADTELPHMPIIALTALAMPGDRERCLAAGATDYMSKPVSLKELGTKIEACLQTYSG